MMKGLAESRDWLVVMAHCRWSFGSRENCADWLCAATSIGLVSWVIGTAIRWWQLAELVVEGAFVDSRNRVALPAVRRRHLTQPRTFGLRCWVVVRTVALQAEKVESDSTCRRLGVPRH